MGLRKNIFGRAWENFKAPTPAKWRKIGYTCLIICTAISALSPDEYPGFKSWIMIAGVLAKIGTSFTKK